MQVKRSVQLRRRRSALELSRPCLPRGAVQDARHPALGVRGAPGDLPAAALILVRGVGGVVPREPAGVLTLPALLAHPRLVDVRRVLGV
jgi:hypothetical protein